MTHDLAAIAAHFAVPGQFITAEPYGNGHINDTYAASYDRADGLQQIIYQRINHDVFKDPVAVMENVRRITAHLRQKLEAADSQDIARRTLTLLPTHDGEFYHWDGQGNCWRAYHFIAGARTYDVVASPEQAYEVGHAFGRFQQQLVDLSGPRLIETIPDFHNTPQRFAALVAAIDADPFNRAQTAKAEIDFALSQAKMTTVLTDLQAASRIPERVTHNDTKINNVMLDDETGHGLCVIDLDTVMPGLALYDFGDMVRTATCLGAEDERDLSKIEVELPLFEALTRGYLTAAGAFLNQTEKDHLAFSGKLITFEIAIRFLTDYLSGDTYFKIHREGHNLDRCRAQFKLVRSISRHEDAMDRLVARL